jgi:RNA recognition motif-containing protein
MSTTIYVANLPVDASEQQVQTLFAQYGEILSMKLISDNETGQMLGYGFVDMPDDAAMQAIQALSGTDFEGQTLQVNQARGRSSDR